MSKEEEKKLDFEGWCGTPGDPWDKFDLRLKNGSSKSDDRGWSYADHFAGTDGITGIAGITGIRL